MQLSHRRLALFFSLAFAANSAGQDKPDLKPLTAAVAAISPHVASDSQREQLRSQLGRSLREQIAAANRTSSAAWSMIDSRDDWEQFRREKQAALRRSLGDMPPRPHVPRSLVTGRIAGDGFEIRNLVYESRPGLVVTANLYVPNPPREKMPGIVIAHSHHNPKEQGELQDMGMTWARAGCYVLVPDHLGHGERRQHPFATAGDFAGPFQLSRQDYYFRYDTSLQLYLMGQTLTGWMVNDLMTGIDLLLAQPGIDSQRIILLGSVAGGGDPAAVTAALDERIACVVPFNFGGPQPETRYPLPDDAETSFNYAGGGSWESTRNLYRSAADGFLPWVIVGSVAPRHLIHAHEFSWDSERDPVWKRYEKIWGLYGARDKLASTQGTGTITGTDPPPSHCNNIGAVHRRPIHEAFRQWFNIDVKPQDEYSQRRAARELTCLTDDARRQFQPKLLHELLAARADEALAASRQRLESLMPAERLQLMRQAWTQALDQVEPPPAPKVRDGDPPMEQISGITIRRELLETEPGISIGLMSLSLAAGDAKRPRPVVLEVASGGIAEILTKRARSIAERLQGGALVALIDVRGMGGAGQGTDHGQQSAATSHAATALMLGQPLLGGQLRDFRAAWRHLQTREGAGPQSLSVAGSSSVEPLPSDAPFSYPRRIDRRPSESEPSAALLALLFALFEDECRAVDCSGGLISFRSVLGSPFVQAPLESVPPAIVREGDLPDLISTLLPRRIALAAFVDGRGRAAAPAAVQPK